MSDYEDDIDMDAPAVRDTVTFSSDNTNSKGKRSAANLPVEAEDSLPWWGSLPYADTQDINGKKGRKIPS